jgi:predicted exporter
MERRLRNKADMPIDKPNARCGFRQRHAALLWLLVAALLLGHNGYLWLVQRITPNTDILALLPAQQQDPVKQQAFDHMVDSAQQRLVVLVGAADWQQAQRAADAYRAVISRRPDLLMQDDAASEQNQRDWLTPFTGSRLGLLTSQQRSDLQTQPADYWTQRALGSLYGAFGGPRLGAWQDDPFGLFSSWVQTRAQETPVRPRDGKLFVEAEGRSYVVLLLRLHQPAFAMSTQQAVMPLANAAKQAALQAVPKSEIITAGVVLHAAAASAQAAGEMSTIGIGSLLGILLMMWLTFRSLKPIALIAVSIGVGCLGALSVCWLLFGQIHLLTLVFGASLIGIAQDYGIYFLCCRLRTDHQQTQPADKQNLLRRIWPGLCLTLAAALIGYLGLTLTPFPGLRQMAVFSGLGLIFAWLTVLCWFPVFTGAGTLRASKLALAFGASRARWPLLRGNRAGLSAVALFIVIAAFGIARLQVSDDIRSLQKPSADLLADQIKLGRLLDAPTPVQFYLIRADTTEQLLQREETLQTRLQALVDSKIISGYQAISSWVPSAKRQHENQQLAQTALLTGLGGDGRGPLPAIAQQIGEDAAWVAKMKAGIAAPQTVLTPETFLQTPAGEPSRYLWLGKIAGADADAGHAKYASIVALRGLNNYANLPLLAQAADPSQEVQWVDKVGEISGVLGSYRRYMSWVAAGAYIAIFALLFWRYRLAAWRVLLPPAAASAATLAALGWLGLPLQLFHVLALMLILGLGVDYGIFLREEPDRHDRFAWLAVGLSAVSALLAFGLLALSQTPPLHAFGLTMLIGMAVVWLIAPCTASGNEFSNESSSESSNESNLSGSVQAPATFNDTKEAND